MRNRLLFNADTVDAVPADLLKPRRNQDARGLANASLVIRRKEDGRFLAVIDQGAAGHRLRPLHPAVTDRALAVVALLRMLGVRPVGALHRRRAVALRALSSHDIALPSAATALRGLAARLDQLGIAATAYARSSGLPLHLEPSTLRFAGYDRYRRALWLHAGAAAAWPRLRAAAAHDGVVLDAISGFRSHAYQHGILRRKLARGLTLQQILTVNAAPGFSEHHSGRAIDIGTPGEPAAEASFDASAAFAWLQQHAGDYGFSLSYPQDNPHGIVYEPWHWCWHPAAG